MFGNGVWGANKYLNPFYLTTVALASNLLVAQQTCYPRTLFCVEKKKVPFTEKLNNNGRKQKRNNIEFSGESILPY